MNIFCMSSLIKCVVRHPVVSCGMERTDRRRGRGSSLHPPPSLHRVSLMMISLLLAGGLHRQTCAVVISSCSLDDMMGLYRYILIFRQILLSFVRALLVEKFQSIPICFPVSISASRGDLFLDAGYVDQSVIQSLTGEHAEFSISARFATTASQVGGMNTSLQAIRARSVTRLASSGGKAVY